jgi:rhomboid protease GluP
MAMGAIVPGTLSPKHWLRLISAIFLHGGFLHLVFNLWAFIQLGYAWEVLFGARRFLFVFFSTGLTASITSARFVEPPGAVGASGAIFGLLSALIVYLTRSPEWRTAAWTRQLSLQLSIWALITIVIGFFSPQIDNAAHLGGVLGGIVVGALMPKPGRDSRSGAR